MNRHERLTLLIASLGVFIAFLTLCATVGFGLAAIFL